jgi:hypothetical protein
MTMRRMPVLAQSACVGSPCQPSSTENSTLFSLSGMDYDPSVPASMSIVGTQDMGYYKIYTYQLVNLGGEPLTDPGYSVAEYVSSSDGSATDTSNGIYLPLSDGQLSDRVGFLNPPTGPQITVATQTFTALYQGYFYDLSTVFQHTTVSSGSNNYNVSITTTVIQP